MNIGVVESYRKADELSKNKETERYFQQIENEKILNNRRKEYCDNYFKSACENVESISYNDILGFGKYKDYSLRNLLTKDKQYVAWFLINNIRIVNDFMMLPNELAFGRKNYISFVEFLELYHPDIFKKELSKITPKNVKFDDKLNNYK